MSAPRPKRASRTIAIRPVTRNEPCGPLEPRTFAAPCYLRTFGRPEHPRDLLGHNCIRYKYIPVNRIQDWQFLEDGQVKTIDAPTTLVFDGMEAVRQVVRDGHGISWSLRVMIENEIQAGTLEVVLDPNVVKLPPYYHFYPEQNRRLGLLRLFIDFLASKRERDAAPVL